MYALDEQCWYMFHIWTHFLNSRMQNERKHDHMRVCSNVEQAGFLWRCLVSMGLSPKSCRQGYLQTTLLESRVLETLNAWSDDWSSDVGWEAPKLEWRTLCLVCLLFVVRSWEVVMEHAWPIDWVGGWRDAMREAISRCRTVQVWFRKWINK